MTSTSTSPALAAELLRIADAAGAAIMALYGAAKVREKADSSPVTEADEAADAVILRELARVAPDIAVITEEEVAKGRAPDPGARFFLVDPLDGTREFISGNGEFTVNIALIENGAPTLGVVTAPAIGRAFWTDGEGGARAREADGAARAIRAVPPPDGGLVAVASRSHRDAATDEWLKGFDVADFRAAGSSLKFCLVAAGEAHLYPRLGRTMEWDIAAGHAVLAAAGGAVWSMATGATMTYGKPGLENPHFVAASFDVGARLRG